MGYHTTEESAARAYGKYLKDGIDPVAHREASTSQFAGVFSNTRDNRWGAASKGTSLGNHVTELEAERAYIKYL
jgi:hypothetical protein